MPAVLTIGKSELKYGYIYELHNRVPYDTTDEERQAIVKSGVADLIPDDREWVHVPAPPHLGHRDRSHTEVVATERREVERFKCSLNAAHGRATERFNFEIDLNYAMQPIPPFINDAEDAHVLVNEWLAERLKTSGLKGFRLLPTRIRDKPEWFVDDKSTPLSKVYQLAFDGRLPRQRARVEPAAADKCPHCGAGPIVCPECGYFYNVCGKCGQSWGAPQANHGGEGDPRILIQSLGIAVDVFDPRRWDGTDFMGSSTDGYITRRALDWLLSVHAGPFLAEPIAVNVLGLDNDERERLELMRRPLPDVKPQSSDQFKKNARQKAR